MEYFELGTTPTEEKCVQVSKTEDYLPAMEKEANRFKEMLQTKFEDFILGDMHLTIKRNSHDFGTYLDVILRYDQDDYAQAECALYICNNLPKKWADIEKPKQAELAKCLVYVQEE